MSKIYYKYGAMGSSKTAIALMTKYNFEEKGRKILLMKPSIDSRDGLGIIKSRIGIEADGLEIPENAGDEWLRQNMFRVSIDTIIIDECQFLNPSQVTSIITLSDEYNKDVWFYGLKTDFKGHLFDGSKRILELADSIEEIKTSCWCGKKATMNARIVDGSVVKDGEQIALGGNESYTSLCRTHWDKNELRPGGVFTVNKKNNNL